ncbi:MAG TPA: type IV toxin-antitoxin system AbiEi family antitoxin domain-containing protein [Solirubrobacterales bacterium]|jgi:very-short-patch-repair endonuclease|nr:type IV toxin-antitoxin system AbiEi family antitoxin domain-containing protein [Solirubrobacterales bacterium]
MGGSTQHSISKRAWRLAAQQHWVITRGQLMALGFGRRAIQRRVARGRLHPVMRGVYAVGRPGLTQQGKWMAATLSCGPEALLSHSSAAALWGFGSELGQQVEVSICAAADRRRPGVHAYRRPGIDARDRCEHCGIPVTSPVRTLIDLAAILSPMALERAVNEADKRELTDPEELRAALARYPNERGVARLRTLLDRRTFRLSDSDLEILFRPIARRAGLPQPQTKQIVNGFEVDFFWPELGLVVETDGLRYHRTPSQQNRALLRDQTHTVAGLTHLRFSHSQIKYEPKRVQADLAAVARRLNLS